MQNIGEIKQEFLVRNQTSTLVAFYTDTILNSWINQAHKWAAGYKKWTITEGKCSTTFASLITDESGYLVGEYPEGWKSDSIKMLRIGGKNCEKKEFYKFCQYLEDNESATDRYFSDFGRQYYVNPCIDISGTVSAWGQYTPAELDCSIPTTNTIFSGEEEGNEAIVEMMMSYARKREKKLDEALAHKQEAQQILEGIYARIQAEQYGYQTPPDDGMFKRFDVLEGGFDGINSNQF